MDSIFGDIRYTLRSIRKSPGLIAVAVVSLGLGIGANVTIFSAVDVFMFRPLPYPEADQLLHVYSTVPERGWTYNSVSIPDFLDIREQSGTMDVATTYGRDFNLSGGLRSPNLRGGVTAAPAVRPGRNLSTRPPGHQGGSAGSAEVRVTTPAPSTQQQEGT